MRLISKIKNSGVITPINDLLRHKDNIYSMVIRHVFFDVAYRCYTQKFMEEK